MLFRESSPRSGMLLKIVVVVCLAGITRTEDQAKWVWKDGKRSADPRYEIFEDNQDFRPEFDRPTGPNQGSLGFPPGRPPNRPFVPNRPSRPFAPGGPSNRPFAPGGPSNRPFVPDGPPNRPFIPDGPPNRPFIPGGPPNRPFIPDRPFAPDRPLYDRPFPPNRPPVDRPYEDSPGSAPGVLTGPVPSWAKEPPFKNFDSCKCAEKFNCNSPGISYGQCDVGKQYCCYSSNKEGALGGPLPSRPVNSAENGVLVGPGGPVDYPVRPQRPQQYFDGPGGHGGVLVGPGGPTGIIGRPPTGPFGGGFGGPFRPNFGARSAKKDSDVK